MNRRVPGRRDFWLALAITLFAALGPAQPQKTFTPNATVVLKDGTSVLLTEFCLFRAGNWGVSLETTGSSGDISTGLPLKQGDLWTEVPVSAIERLSLRKDSDDTDFLLAEISPVKGGGLKGEVPMHGSLDYWRPTGYLALRGRRTLLGVEGTWERDIEYVRSVTRLDGQKATYSVTDAEGKSFEIRDPEVIHHYASEAVGRCLGKDATLPLNVDNTDLELRLDRVSILRLSWVSKDWANIRLRMRDGQEAEGQIKGLAGAMGRTETSQLWYRALYSKTNPVTEIRFK